MVRAQLVNLTNGRNRTIDAWLGENDVLPEDDGPWGRGKRGRMIGTDELKEKPDDRLRSAFSKVGMDFGLPTVKLVQDELWARRPPQRQPWPGGNRPIPMQRSSLPLVSHSVVGRKTAMLTMVRMRWMIRADRRPCTWK